MNINRFKRRLERLIERKNIMEKKHCGNENGMTYHGGFDLGYIRGRIVEIEEILDELEDVDLIKKSKNLDGKGEIDFDNIPNEIIELVFPELVFEHRFVPVQFEDDVLTVATANEIDLYTLDNLRFVTNSKIELIITSNEKIDKAIKKYYSQPCECRLDEIIIGGNIGEDSSSLGN